MSPESSARIDSIKGEIQMAIGISAQIRKMEDHHFDSVIYVLVKNGEVIYVGQTGDLIGRISTHKKMKVFDAVLFIECSQDNLNWMEGLLIKYFKPEQNIAKLTCSSQATNSKLKCQEDMKMKIRNLLIKLRISKGATKQQAMEEACNLRL